MTSLVEEYGEDGALELIVGRVADGEMTLADVSKSMGLTYSVLWRWLAGDPERMAAYRASLEAKADMEAHRILEIADGADAETVAVDKLRIDSRKWLSERWGRKQYGGEAEKNGGGITVVVERGMKAEVTVGGVLRIGSDTDKGYPAEVLPANSCGYPADTAPPIDGELVI